MNSRRFTVSHAPRNPPTKNLAQSSSKQLPRTQPVNAMSALPPKADMVQRDRDVCHERTSLVPSTTLSAVAVCGMLRPRIPESRWAMSKRRRSDCIRTDEALAVDAKKSHIRTSPTKDYDMASRQIKMPAKNDAEKEAAVVFFTRQAARARPIFAPGRPPNEGFIRDIRSCAIGGRRHQKGLSDRSGERVRQRRLHAYDG
jgi:hypothetical protein